MFFYDFHPQIHSDPITVDTLSSASQTQTNIGTGLATTSRFNTNTMYAITITNNSTTVILPIYVFAAILATFLCTVVGIITTVCVLRQIIKRKRATVLAVPLYDEITDPIYATVPGDKSKSGVDSANRQFELSANDAYKQILSQDKHTAQPQGMNISLTAFNDNTAYVPSNSAVTTDSVTTTWNDSYQFATSMRSQKALAKTKNMIIGSPTYIHTSPQGMMSERSADPGKEIFNTDWKGISCGSSNSELFNLNPTQVFKQHSEAQNKSETKGSVHGE